MSATVLHVSGGKDSTAMYLYALERLGDAFTPIFCDTGNEHEITYEYIATLAEKTGGPAIRVVRNDFAERLIKRRAFIFENYESQRISAALAAIDAALEENSPFYLFVF